MSFIYIASSYSADTIREEHRRYEEVFAFTGQALQAGYVCYSPIVHDHEIGQQFNLPRSWGSFWQRQSFGLLCKASELWVLKNTGWEESKGIQAEIKLAQEIGMPILFFELGGELPDRMNEEDIS